MASRAEQKAAARAAREARQQQLKVAQARRQRLMALGGMLTVAIVALIVVILVSTGGGGKASVHLTRAQKATAIATVDATLAGIPQHGIVLGNPSAPVTITEYGDLVCPVCAAFAQSTEPGIISSLVKTGKAKFVFRAFETASGTANGSMFVNTQVAARSAGLQDKEWNYVLLAYQEQPATINGTPAEQVSYITMGYLQNLASQIGGLNTIQWQAHMTDPSLINQVEADNHTAPKLGATGTPAIFVTGPKGTILYDRNGTVSAVPSVQAIQSLVSQVS